MTRTEENVGVVQAILNRLNNKYLADNDMNFMLCIFDAGSRLHKPTARNYQYQILAKKIFALYLDIAGKGLNGGKKSESIVATNTERIRLREAREDKAQRNKWGPYLCDGQCGTVREDYRELGDAYELSHSA